MSSQPKPSAIGCSSGCATKVDDEEAALQAGWERLQITAAWRCPACYRALRQAAGIVGTQSETPDLLPKNSRGAIVKATAKTILPPSYG